jgi:hypothetical protein
MMYGHNKPQVYHLVFAAKHHTSRFGSITGLRGCIIVAVYASIKNDKSLRFRRIFGRTGFVDANLFGSPTFARITFACIITDLLGMMGKIT